MVNRVQSKSEKNIIQHFLFISAFAKAVLYNEVDVITRIFVLCRTRENKYVYLQPRFHAVFLFFLSFSNMILCHTNLSDATIELVRRFILFLNPYKRQI